MPDENAPVRRIDLGPVTAYAIAKAKGFPGTEDEWNTYIANASLNASLALSAKDAAIDARDAASQKASDSEAYALGTRDGESVPSTDVAYQNNAKYYSEQAAGSQALVSDSETVVLGAKADVLQLKTDVTQLKTDTIADATQIKTDILAAQTATQISQAAAAQNASDAEAYAVGTRGGAAVPVGDPAYHKNSKYYSDQTSVTYGEIQLMADNIEQAVSQRGNRLYFDEEEKLLYLMSDDEKLGEGIAVSTGGGGGGGGGGGTEYEYVVTLTNLMPSRNISLAAGSNVILEFSYSSVNTDEENDGAGVGTIYVDNGRVGAFSVAQGNNTLDVTQYVDGGLHTVKIRVDNSEGRYKTLTYNVNLISLSISTTFPDMSVQSTSVAFTYVLQGAGSKTVHYVLNGVEIGTDTINSNNRSQTFDIPAQTHGAYVFECYADMIVGDATVVSNILRHGIMWTDPNYTSPIILTTFKNGTVEQGENLHIPIIVYTPQTETSDVTLSVIANGETYSSEIRYGVDQLTWYWDISDYPIGSVTFRIESGGVHKDILMTVNDSSVIINPVTDSLTLLFDPTGRSNNEEDPENWSYESIEASFTGFGWNMADGWLRDSEHAPVLRFLPGDSMTIPFMPFATDARVTGYTIEVELATRDVRDYETVVLSCLSGNRGIQIRSQEARLSSEQSGASMLFKEDSKVRVTFSIENRTQYRFIYIYIDGIMCSVTQYPTNDNFQQSSPVGITIGAETCAIDLYKIRCYAKGLTRMEQLDNFIADRPTLFDRRNAALRNDILNDRDEVTIDKLPLNLSYILLKCPQLPQYKGDKKTGVEVEFVDRANPKRSWTATGVELDVQGTSSAVYPIKNYKIKLKSGITYTDGGATASGFPIHTGEIPTKTICYKADYASSENANNVMLAKLYNDICPYKTEPQRVEGSKVRQGIDGFSTTLFWENTTTGDITFLGKGNCNTDKGNPNIFGFTSDYPNAQSWEFKNNTSNRVLFKSDDFTSMGVDEQGHPIVDWQNDFEARYPEDSLDISAFSQVVSWVVSTDRDAVEGDSAKAARLQKFEDEFEDHFVKSAMLFYYVFTETFLMVDSRAKNMFMTTYDGTHWFSLPYDFDTAIGINNEGSLVFDYHLEDTDTVQVETQSGTTKSADVFNGQHSVLWNNIRDAFGDEIRLLYQTLRSMNDSDPSGESPFSYYRVAKMFTEHQSVWPEALWNEDAFVKYLQPYIIDGKNNLAMLQGNKASQRDWWLFNAFRYRDSKYQCGDADKNFIELRCYHIGNITITPYSNIHGRIKYGSSTTQMRCFRNQSYEMVCGLDAMNDTEVHIFSADRLSSVGDLSGLQVGRAIFASAVKLQSIKLGDEDPSFENTTLGLGDDWFTVGNNELLTYVNVANCSIFGTGNQKALDLSGCTGIETVIATGTKLASINLPNGGHLETLKLPDTITNFTILNQSNLTTLYFDGYGNITTLRVENTPNVPIRDLIHQNPNLDRVRLIGVEWTETSAANLEDTIDILKDCGGQDASGNNLDHAVVTGRVNVPSISGELLLDINEHFPELVVVVNNVPQYLVKYYNYSSTTGEFSDRIYTLALPAGSAVPNPVTAGYIQQTPTRPDTADTKYVFADFGDLPTSISSHLSINVRYSETYLVTFMNGSTQFATQWIPSGSSATNPSSTPTKAATPANTFTFAGWTTTVDGRVVEPTALLDISAPRTVYAVYTVTGRTYTVRFYNGATLLQTVNNVPYGESATYTGTTPVHPTDPDNNEFIGFNPTGQNIEGDTDCYATWKYTGINSRKIMARTISGFYANSTITYIGSDAFIYCSNLRAVSFPEVTTIDSEAFYSCVNLSSISFPKAVYIGNAAFYACSSISGEVTFPNLLSVDVNAFCNCSRLNNISAPKLQYIGSSAFMSCSLLTNISAPELQYIDGNAFMSCGKLRNISFPKVSVVGTSAFYDGRLTSVTLPEAVTIGINAFYSCPIQYISIPKVQYISESAMCKCSMSGTLSLPALVSVKDNAFAYCSNVERIIAPKLGYIGTNAFMYMSNLSVFVLGTELSSVCYLKYSTTFSGASNLNIYVPDSLVESYRTSTVWTYLSSRIKGISEYST